VTEKDKKSLLVSPADVAAAAAGDTGAFGRLVQACQPLVASVALAALRDPDDAMDVVQETFLVAWRDLHRLRAPEAFVSWLRQIARNQAAMALRRGVRRPSFADAELPLVAPQVVVPADEQLLDREARGIVSEVLGELPEPAREVLVLFYSEGGSVRRVADSLDLQEATVRKRLSRARSVLREETLARFGDEVQSRGRRSVAPAILAAIGPGRTALAAAGATVAAGVSASVLMGTAGVFLGFWVHWRRTRDREEARGLVAVTIVNLIAASGFPIAAMWGGKLALFAGLAVFLSLMAWSNLVWLPRIVGPRQALERIESPSAALKQRALKVLSHAGLIGGAVGGSLAIALSQRPW
jgi:RNA polymerase sigma factor (sigma-70 family)